MMEVQRIPIVLLALAVIVGSVRMLWFAWRRSPRPRAWRVALLLLLQFASAALLYRVLFPPPVATGAETLVVATAHAPTNLARTLSAHERLVALPEAGSIANAEPVPDLATALRRYPATARLRIAGRGLTARDRDSVSGLPFAFAPVPLPRGLVELPVSLRVHTGADFAVQGRAHDVAGGSAELLDPSGQRVDKQPLAQDGRFVLTGATRGAGLVEFRVRIVDARGETVEEGALPVAVSAPARTRVLLLAGAPDGEIKYLRRWALDSGVRLTAQIQLGGGMQLGDASVSFSAATLKGFDAVIVDERTWDGLGDARRRALLDAVRNGLGLIVRVTGPVSSALRNQLGAVGLRVSGAAIPPGFALPAPQADDFAAVRLGPGSDDAPTANTVATAELPELTRPALRIEVANARAWLHDDKGRALAAWRPVGQGRMGVWLPIDTFKLVLAGRNDLHARLWSEAVAAVARPVAASSLVVDEEGRQGTRMTLCGLGETATVAPPGRSPEPLLIDPATGTARCAGFWPQASGWHTLRSGDASTPFFVRTIRELPSVAARQDLEATRRLALQPPRRAGDGVKADEARWTWFLAWLLISAILWSVERARIGRAS